LRWVNPTAGSVGGDSDYRHVSKAAFGAIVRQSFSLIFGLPQDLQLLLLTTHFFQFPDQCLYLFEFCVLDQGLKILINLEKLRLVEACCHGLT
jgi:hypothetical protein